MTREVKVSLLMSREVNITRTWRPSGSRPASSTGPPGPCPCTCPRVSIPNLCPTLNLSRILHKTLMSTSLLSHQFPCQTSHLPAEDSRTSPICNLFIRCRRIQRVVNSVKSKMGRKICLEATQIVCPTRTPWQRVEISHELTVAGSGRFIQHPLWTELQIIIRGTIQRRGQ